MKEHPSLIQIVKFECDWRKGMSMSKIAQTRELSMDWRDGRMILTAEVTQNEMEQKTKYDYKVKTFDFFRNTINQVIEIKLCDL